MLHTIQFARTSVYLDVFLGPNGIPVDFCCSNPSSLLDFTGIHNAQVDSPREESMPRTDNLTWSRSSSA